VTVANTVYNDLTIEATDREDAWRKGMEASPNLNDGYVVEDTYIEHVEELD
jgi:hypothetical protein